MLKLQDTEADFMVGFENSPYICSLLHMTTHMNGSSIRQKSFSLLFPNISELLAQCLSCGGYSVSQCLFISVPLSRYMVVIW